MRNSEHYPSSSRCSRVVTHVKIRARSTVIIAASFVKTKGTYNVACIMASHLHRDRTRRTSIYLADKASLEGQANIVTAICHFSICFRIRSLTAIGAAGDVSRRLKPAISVRIERAPVYGRICQFAK